MSNKSYADNEAVKAYVDFYIENLAQIAEVGKFIPLSEDLYAETQTALEGIAS